MPAWRLADRTLELEAPGTVVGAGIVNVTVDSMYEGARSGTAEQAITDGIALVERGFEMVDVGGRDRRSGSGGDEVERLIPAIAGLAGRTDAAVSADTFVPEVATAAVPRCA